MENSLLCFLERSAERYPDRDAYADADRTYTYAQMVDTARRVGSALCPRIAARRRPVAVYMEKSADCVAAFFGVLYSGNFYCPIDPEMPVERIRVILDVLRPEAVITTEALREKAASFSHGAKLLQFEALAQSERLDETLDRILGKTIETDPAYVLFTSGSTGVPKGVLLPHRVLIRYLHDLDRSFDLGPDDVFGNQAPLYFDISTHDIYGAAYFGAKMVIIPQHLFGFPVKLIEYLNEQRVTTFLWVPSAMGIIARLRAFKAILPQHLRVILFAGEVLPKKHLDYWAEHLPEAVFANLYGPTETFVCTWYIRRGDEPEDAPLPIGHAVADSETLVLDEAGNAVAPGEIGELCLRGSCLALGYYNDPERTAAAFVPNPLLPDWPDRIYRTGDLVRERDDGELLYVSRKDYQIKRMGYRIELGEIETAASRLEGVAECACTYLERRSRIVLWYEGVEQDRAAMLAALEARLPKYMLPDQLMYMPSLPRNANGKLDRKALQAQTDAKQR